MRPAVPSASATPTYIFTAHNQGKIQLVLSNYGRFGVPKDSDPLSGFHIPTEDPLSQEEIFYCTYPKVTNSVWTLYMQLLAGGIRGKDTVVANVWSDEVWVPDETDIGTFRFESGSRAKANLFTDSARSDLDIYCVYIDSVPDRPGGMYGHRPTMLKVSQRSMAWSGGGSDDFILVEDRFTNVGSETLSRLYFGLQFENRVYHRSELEDTLYFPSYEKNLTGFLRTYGGRGGCSEPDTVNIAYVMAADARPFIKQWTKYSAIGAVGVRMIRIPAGVPTVNYNWYSRSPFFAPRKRGTEAEPYREYSFLDQMPWDEHEYYYFLSHKEIDYDQMFTAVDHYWEGWKQPPEDAVDIANGVRATATLSFGTFDLPPGAEASVVWAIVGGDSVHVGPTDYDHLWNPESPDRFYNSLNFKALAENARWAGWVYDNPGFDTDGDGYLGKYDMCDGDTVWYEGDGVPDWRAEGPPPSPEIRVIPTEGSMVVRWNGFFSEVTPDPLTRVRDFEGYRIYLGLDSRPSSFSLIRSFDYENYVRYKLVGLADGRWVWLATDLPLTLDSLRVLYADPEFEPLVYDREHPLVINGQYYCFSMQSYNSAQLTADGIHRVYPDAIKPSMDSSQWTDEEVTLEHGRRLPKYYEYEIVVTNLLPTVEYWVSVTAFDFGFITGDIAAQESDVYENVTRAWAVRNSEEVAEDNLNVYVWPNPYRYDADYDGQGYENHDQSLWYDRARRIHFGNLPNMCKISILSLDGDLVKEIIHDYPSGDPRSTHDYWDLISRNSLLAVSGIYYWVVEGGGRTQMGKLVVIE